MLHQLFITTLSLGGGGRGSSWKGTVIQPVFASKGVRRALQQLGLVISIRIDRMHVVKTTPGVCRSKQTCEIKLLNSIQTATASLLLALSLIRPRGQVQDLDYIVKTRTCLG